MGCGCGGKSAKAQPVQRQQQQNVSPAASNNVRRCPKCQATMVYKQQFVAKLKGYIKLWECPNKPCNYKIVGR